MAFEIPQIDFKIKNETCNRGVHHKTKERESGRARFKVRLHTVNCDTSAVVCFRKVCFEMDMHWRRDFQICHLLALSFVFFLHEGEWAEAQAVPKHDDRSLVFPVRSSNSSTKDVASKILGI